MHPVPLHPLQEPQGRHGHFVVLLTKLQQVGEARDIQAGVCGRHALSTRPGQRPRPPSGPPSPVLPPRAAQDPSLEPAAPASGRGPMLGSCCLGRCKAEAKPTCSGLTGLCSSRTLLSAFVCLHPSVCSLRERQPAQGDSAEATHRRAPGQLCAGTGFTGPPASGTAAPRHREDLLTTAAQLDRRPCGPVTQHRGRPGDRTVPESLAVPGAAGAGGRGPGWEAPEAQSGIGSALQPLQQQTEGRQTPAGPPSVHGTLTPQSSSQHSSCCLSSRFQVSRWQSSGAQGRRPRGHHGLEPRQQGATAHPALGVSFWIRFGVCLFILPCIYLKKKR